MSRLLRLFILLYALTVSAPVMAKGVEDSAPVAGDYAALARPLGRHFMVAAANPYAAQAGDEILAAGGSAADALIAMQWVLSLVEPQSSGVGGGGFALYHDKAHETLHSYDGRETAPAAATERLFLDKNGAPLVGATVGGRTVGVPGTVKLAALLHARHGILPWARLFEPAIRLAEEGFRVSPRLHYLLQTLSPQMKAFPAAAGFYYRSDGTPLPVGFTLKDPDYAALLHLLARDGEAGYYSGLVADDVAAATQAAGGALTSADMARYEAKERPPLCMAYRVYKVCSMGPPSSGGSTLLASLKMLERFDLAALGAMSPDSLHLMAEAMRLAYADRDRYLADPDFVAVPIAGLLDPTYLKARSALISLERRLPVVRAGEPAGATAQSFAAHTGPEWPSTSHFTAMDAQGNVAAMTASIQTAFGSLIRVRGHLLNNELTDFSVLPAREGVAIANRVGPGKRPRSSMTPTIVYDAQGKVVLTLGSPGGPQIIGYVLKTLVAVLDWRQDLATALALPNVVERGQGLELEAGRFTPEAIMALAQRGHPVRLGILNSGVQAIATVDAAGQTMLQGAADPRREGVALGR